jgi:uncharacterized protein
MRGRREGAFLTARWWLHRSVLGVLVAGRLSHVDDGLVAAAGLPAPTEPPVSVLYAPAVGGRFGLDVRVL